MVGGLELGGGAQELLGFGAVGAGQHQAEIQVGLEDVRLGGDRLAIGVDGFFSPAETVVDESEIEPGLIVFGIAMDSFFQ